MTTFRQLEDKDIPADYIRCTECYGDGVEDSFMEGLVKCYKCDGKGIIKPLTPTGTAVSLRS